LIALIWAQAHDAAGRGVIGAKGDIPWHLPEDFAHFKQLTAGHPVIMGERTWVSLPKKPLPNRTNIVLTASSQALLPAQMQHLGDGGSSVQAAGSLSEGFDLASKAPGGDEVWVIGGESVYRQAIAYADRLEVTEIDLVVAGDTFAPVIPLVEFSVMEEPWKTGANGLRYRFRSYQRVSESRKQP